MNLVIDVGNSVVKVGFFKAEDLLFKGSFSTYPLREPDEWGMLLINWFKVHSGHCKKVDNAIICSVVNNVSFSLKRAVCKYFCVSPKDVTPDVAGIPILYTDSSQLGSDRIANAVAAARMYKLPAVIIDFGTATTFDVISRKGEYLGGVIAPGVSTIRDSLWQRTEKLFPVELKKPYHVIGKDTRENLTSGIFYTLIGAITRILEMIEQEIGQAATIVATGGWSGIIGSELEEVGEINPNLTLQGINFIALDLSENAPYKT